MYNFAGELTASKRYHHNGTALDSIGTTYENDHMGRKLATKEYINGQAEVVLSKLKYNEIGQLLSKSVHSTDNGISFLQNSDYTYNERGWTKGMASDQFSYALKYADGDAEQYKQYNGNIGYQLWGAGATLNNQFIYGYDKLNRLISGVAPGMSEQLSYDVMGNITSLTRDGATGTYSYTDALGNPSNKLQRVTGGWSTGDYSYDVNGNAITDGNNGASLTYNILNLPATVNKAAGAGLPAIAMNYVYAADGTKLKKIGGLMTNRDYIDGIEYNAGNIDVIMTEEGLARRNGTNYSYEYNLTDHLGNVRYTFTKDPISNLVSRIQSDDYYPFGMRKSNAPVSEINKYLYNGKELQDELKQYDYSARFYDPKIGRWNVVDPLAFVVSNYNPYNYCYNNPVNVTDPNGMLAVYNWETGEYMQNGTVVSWATVQQQISERGLGVTYTFRSGDDGRTSPVTKEKKGNKNNEFFYNGNRFTANSLQTLKGRDDSDDRIGSFNGIVSLGESELVEILGQSAFLFFDQYKNNIELAVVKESVNGQLDYKLSAYDILKIQSTALLQINGKVYNANEAGNFLWGMALEYHSSLFDPNWLAEKGTKGRHDEPWEQRAISAGRALARKFLKAGEGFKNKVLDARLNRR